jgi:hypothetical protein
MRRRVLATLAVLVVGVAAVLLVVGNPFAAASVGPPVATDAPPPTTGAATTDTDAGTDAGTDSTATDDADSTAASTTTVESTDSPESDEATAGTRSRTHTPGPDGYDWRTVTLHDDADGAVLATVDVRLADTADRRYTGLSNTESLGADEGMLFVHPAEGHYSYVMRRMDFPLDIVFVADNGTVTRIHHAPLPSTDEDGDLLPYRGYGRYVLEVPLDYTTEHGVEPGDYLRVHETDLNASTAAAAAGPTATTTVTGGGR